MIALELTPALLPRTIPAMTSQEQGFHDFAAFAARLKGDEKSEAQTFLFHLLEAFNHDPNTLPDTGTGEAASFHAEAKGLWSKGDRQHNCFCQNHGGEMNKLQD